MATTIKTTISIEKSLFEQVESLAKRLHISRSRLFGLAIESFIKNERNKILLEEINRAYTDEPDSKEKLLIPKMQKQHRKLAESEGY